MGKYTEQEIKNIESTVISYEDCVAFMHCKHCLAKKPENKSPREYISYEVAICKILIAGRKVGIMTVWCKRCKKLVWDSRHLDHAY